MNYPASTQVFAYSPPISDLVAQIRQWQSTPFLSECQMLGSSKFYSPPLDWLTLAKLVHQHPYHSCAINFKRDTVAMGAKPRQAGMDKAEYFLEVIPWRDWTAAVTDFMTLQNAFLRVRRNRIGEVIGLAHLPAVLMRKTPTGGFLRLDGWKVAEEYPASEIVHIYTTSPENNLYGIPPYLAIFPAFAGSNALNTALELYGKNGHMGLFLALAYNDDGHLRPAPVKEGDDPELIQEAEKKKSFTQRLKETVDSATKDGLGKTIVMNFKPENNNDADVRKNILIHEMWKDFDKLAFRDIIETTALQILAAHRVPAQLAGAAFAQQWAGKLAEVAAVFNAGTVQPIQSLFFYALNRALPKPLWIDFDPYAFSATAADNTP